LKQRKNNNGFARKEKRRLYAEIRHGIEKLLTYHINKRRARFSKEDHIKFLVSASLFNAFAEGMSNSLRNAPSADTLLHYIESQDQEELLKAFESELKRSVGRLKRQRKLWKRISIAIDWTDEMYYGDHKITPMVNGTKPKDGSSYAFQFLTVAVLVDGERLVLGVLPIKSRSDLPTLVLHALDSVIELGVKIKDVTVDAGFFSGEMIEAMKAEFEKNGLKYIIRMPENCKTKKMKKWDGRRFPYTLKVKRKKKRKGAPPALPSSNNNKQVSFEVVAAYDKKKKHMYLFVTNLAYKSQTILHLYNQRWGIETGYRMYNQFLIKTTSRNYVVRLFYFLFACVMYNAWVLYNAEQEQLHDTLITVIQLKMFLLIEILMNLVAKAT
jgi:IS4 transposase